VPGNDTEYHVTGRRDELQEPRLKFRVNLMDLTSDDKQLMKFNPKHFPRPAINDQRSASFHLALGIRIVYEPNSVKSLVRRLTIF
jgi:hypothetical protein